MMYMEPLPCVYKAETNGEANLVRFEAKHFLLFLYSKFVPSCLHLNLNQTFMRNGPPPQADTIILAGSPRCKDPGSSSSSSS